MPTGSRARSPHGSPRAKTGPCSPSQASGRPGAGSEDQRAPRSNGEHQLFGFLTTEPNAIVAPIHPKAMPVILTTQEEVDLWLGGEIPEALKLQQPLPDDLLRIVARGEKEDPPQRFEMTGS
jgi:putative SOS response-associated peptidase YedK